MKTIWEKVIATRGTTASLRPTFSTAPEHETKEQALERFFVRRKAFQQAVGELKDAIFNSEPFISEALYRELFDKLLLAASAEELSVTVHKPDEPNWFETGEKNLGNFMLSANNVASLIRMRLATTFAGHEEDAVNNTLIDRIKAELSGGPNDESDQKAKKMVGELKEAGDVETLRHVIGLQNEAYEYQYDGVREEAARALGDIGAPAAIGPLVVALADESGMVSELAREALERIDEEWAKTGAARKAIPTLADLLVRRSDRAVTSGDGRACGAIRAVLAGGGAA